MTRITLHTKTADIKNDSTLRVHSRW